MKVDMAMLRACVQRAALAPTVHNTQPTRWALAEDGATLFCDTDRGLYVGDPVGRDAMLSCGAVLEGMVLALSACGIGARVELAEAPDCAPGRGLVTLAHLHFAQGTEDGLHRQLELRFTWRGPFDAAPMELFGWTRADARLVLDMKNRQYIAELNDEISLDIMQNRGFRKELLAWMRLSPGHPRYGLDGMSREAMQMSGFEAFGARAALGPLWPVLNALGLTRGLTAEAELTSTAPVIALFYRPKTESWIDTGRAYLRLCLEAASLGMAGWPMAALSDDPRSNAELCTRFNIGPDQRLVQVIRFGKPTGAPPPRARRSLAELLVDG